MDKLYERINWHDLPDTTTPLSEINLNKMDNAIDLIDSRVAGIGTNIELLSTEIQFELDASEWDDNEQTVTVAGITPTTKGIVSLSMNANEDEREACRKAMLFVTGQDDDSITVVADGEVPTDYDIPLTILILG